MAQFEVEQQSLPDREQYDPCGTQKAATAADAVGQIAEETGDYRARLVGEEVWGLFNVSLDAATGRKLVEPIHAP